VQTRNQIRIALPFVRVGELYTCRDLLPTWSPGFVSFELVSGEHGDLGTVYRQRYQAMGKQIEELMTILSMDMPRGFHTMSSDPAGTMYRDTTVRFEAIDDGTTRITVHNQFSGEKLPLLVHEDLQAYTQQYLEIFRTFAESRSDP
jgi:hypothetical protein